MKMKKKMPWLICLALLLFWTGCSSHGEELTSGSSSTSSSSSSSRSTATIRPSLANNPDTWNTCGDFSYVVEDGRAVILDYSGLEPSLTIPTSLDGIPVGKIGNNAFLDCYQLTEVTLEEGIQEIANQAFRRCDVLRSVTLPASVRWVEEGAFYNCKSLQTIQVEEENPIYLSRDGILFAREGETLLAYPEGRTEESYQIPETTAAVASMAFGYYPRHLRTLILPAGVTQLPAEGLSQIKEGLTWEVEAGSAAEAYAKENQLAFQIVSP